MDTETNAAAGSTAAAASTAAPAPEPTSPYFVVQQAVSENGTTYLKNQKVMLTAARAQALGAMVRPWSEDYILAAPTLTLGTTAYKKGDALSLPRDVALRLGGNVKLAPAPQAITTPAPEPAPAAPAPANKVPQPPAPKPAMTVVPPAMVTPPANAGGAK